MVGAEYLAAPALEALWNELGAAFQTELAESKTSLQDVRGEVAERLKAAGC